MSEPDSVRDERLSPAPLSIERNAALPNELAPLFTLGADVCGELLRRAAHRIGARLGEFLANVRLGEDRCGIAVETRDYFLGCAGRNRYPAPRQRLVARKGGFGNRWYLRERRGAFVARHAKRAQPPRPDKGNRARHV